MMLISMMIKKRQAVKLGSAGAKEVGADMVANAPNMGESSSV